MVFSVFELSPLESSVHRCLGRLRRHFPEDAIAIPWETWKSQSFRLAVADTLANIPCQPVEEMQPQSKQASISHPFMITSLFTSFLRAHHGKTASNPGIWKHTREEVLKRGADGSPWRRSPFWLLITVTLNLTLSPPNSRAALICIDAVR